METEDETNARKTEAGVANATEPDGKAWVSLFGRAVTDGNSDVSSHQEKLNMEAASHSAATCGQPTPPRRSRDTTCAQNPQHHEQILSCDQENHDFQKSSTIPLPTPRESHTSNERAPHNDQLPSPKPGDITGNDEEHEEGSASEHHVSQKRSFQEEQVANQQLKPDEAEGVATTAEHEVPLNEAPAKKKRKTVIKYRCGKDAREQAVVRGQKKHDKLKEHIRKLMQRKGPDLEAEDVPPPPPIRRRGGKAQASEQEEDDDSEGSIDPEAPEPEVHDVKAKDRIKEINAAATSGGLTNRRTGSQRADLKEAIKVFGRGKVRTVKTDKEMIYQLTGMQAFMKHFQLVGSSWMVKRETDDSYRKGGLLADAPGLGKTIMSLATIVGNPPSPEQIAKGIKATLVVLPNVETVAGWEKQIKEHLEYANAQCYHYKGSKVGDKTAAELSDRNIILTTYAELRHAWPSAERREQLRGQCTTTTIDDDGEITTEIDEENCDQLCWQESGLLIHVGWYRVIFDEVHAVRNIKSQTCVAARKLQYTIFWGLSGTPCVNAVTELLPYLRLIGWTDVETLADYKQKYIKDVNAQERMDAVVSLFSFRRTHADRFLGEKMITLPKSNSGTHWVNFTNEERVVYDLTNEILQIAGFKGIDRVNLQREAVSHPYLLETFFRTKLSPEALQRYIEDLAQVEHRRSAHQQIGSWSERQIRDLEAPNYDEESESSSTMVSFGKSDFGGKFQLSPLLEVVLNTKTLQTSQCPVCRRGNGQFDDPRQMEVCKHVFCDNCIIRFWMERLDEGKKPYCPECSKMYFGKVRERLPEFTVFQKTLPALKQKSAKSKDPLAEASNRRPGDDYFGVQPAFGKDKDGFWTKVVVEDMFGNGGIPTPSAKTTAVKDIVLQWLQDDPDHKGIIFTEFVTTALVIGRMLQLEGINFVYLNGKVSASEKKRALKGFEELKQIPYLVATMGCGGQSLNLMFASRTIMCDTWWNKSAEKQAFGRVYRYGQKKTTHCIRILARDTIDDNMDDMQETKDTAIQRTLHDDGHETKIHSDHEIMKWLEPEEWLAWIEKCLGEIRQENELMPETMDLDCRDQEEEPEKQTSADETNTELARALLDLGQGHATAHKTTFVDLETEYPDEPRPPSNPYGPQDIGREY